GESRPGRDRARALHRLEGHPRDRRRPARRVHPEQRRHDVPVHRRAGRLRAAMADQADAAARDVTANRKAWTQINAAYTDDRAYRAWMASEIAWGIFNVPESQLGVLGDVRDLHVVELGCGTAYFSAWLARRGAR